MLWTLAIILFVLWILGLVFKVAGGLVYILLALAIIIAAYQLITGRRAV
jgi:hypothetical protein